MRQLLAQIIYLLSHHVSRFTFISHWLCKEMNTTTGAVSTFHTPDALPEFWHQTQNHHTSFNGHFPGEPGL